MYNPLADGNGTSSPDGGSAWAVPSGGATINLNFFTSDSDLGGHQLPSEGYGNFTVSGAMPVPEPATWAGAVLVAAAVGYQAIRRRLAARC